MNGQIIRPEFPDFLHCSSDIIFCFPWKSQNDIHINIIGGGKVDGPSAGAALTALIISLLEEKPIWQDVAITGEISITGEIKAVGGVVEKIYGAKQSGMRKILIPNENKEDIPENIKDIEIKIVNTINDVMQELI